MADYNIYIHYGGMVQNSNPTQPWANNGEGQGPMQVWRNQQTSDNDISEIETPRDLINLGKGQLSKGVAKVAAAFAVIKGVEKVTVTALEYQSLSSGDYRAQHTVNNYKVMMTAMTNPMGTAFNIISTMLKENIENQKRQQYRELLGDSVINSYTNRGV